MFIIKMTRLYFMFVIQYIKMLMQSKLDFMLGMVAFVSNQFFGILFLVLVFKEVLSLDGWTLNQVLFVYAFSQIPKGIDHLFTNNLWSLAWYQIRIGSFDKYLLRPANVLFQVISEEIQFDGLGEILIGSILLRWSCNEKVVFDCNKIILMVLSIIFGTVIYFAIKIICTSVSFWTKESGELLQTVYQVSDFSKYPASIYPLPIRMIITYLLPFALVAYYPACYFLDKGINKSIIFYEGVVAIISFSFAVLFFNIGISKYESVGN